MGSFRRNRSEFGKDFESSAIHEELSSITFRPYSSNEIKQLSACHVFNPNSFNQLGHPIPNGLYDLKMGPFTDRNDLKCATCLLISSMCPGHVGHIELPLPVCNPLFYSTILRLLKMSCMTCHKFRVPPHLRQLYLVQQTLLDYGNIIAAQKASEMIVLPSAQDLSNLDDDEKGGGKKSKVDRSFDEELIKEKLLKFLQDESKIYEESNDCSPFSDNSIIDDENLPEPIKVTRNVESLRKAYNKEFLALHAKASTCPNCGAVTKNIVFYKSRFIYEGFKLNTGDGEGNESQNFSMASARKRGKGQAGEREKTELTAQEIKDHFRSLWQSDHELLSSLFPMLKQDKNGNIKEKEINNMGDCNYDEEWATDIFFVDVLAVPPPNTRPCQFTGGSLTIHPQSTSLQRLIETVTVLKQVLLVVRQDVQEDNLSPEAKAMIKGLRGEHITAKMDSIWKEMQADVDRVLDREMNTSKSNAKTGWGFKQLIERKQGLFRMHMMGKRVNFAARTVITPDPNIAIDEIGLPEVFAKKLSYRVPVTPNNVEWLRKLVMNGPEVHPGAVYVESGGNKTPISATSQTQREALAKTLLTPATSRDDSYSQSNQGIDPTNSIKYVWRHLINGDAMLLNRQPTLHKPSIMSHRARVLKGEKVMRLHYAICKSYNADFDGDEMNAHFPQNEIARSEAYSIVNVCKQYLVPKDGTPLQGLIQDHVIAGVKMTIRGRFFTKSQYQKHVFNALVDFPGKIKTLPPAIIKPQELWSGKQVVSTIVLNLVPEGRAPPTLMTSAKVKTNEWEKARPRQWKCGGFPCLPPPSKEFSSMSESEVIFRNGEFLAGVLDKNQFGATQYSLTHAFFELYGGEYSGKLLSAFSKVFTSFLHTEGFTLGVRDILVQNDANEERHEIMIKTTHAGDICAANAVGLDPNKPESYTEEDLSRKLEEAHREGIKNPRRRAEVDRHYKDVLSKATNQINKACLPKGLIRTFPENNLQLMVQAGAKGSTVNTMQISCLLGQIELEGKRPPLMISGKSLPSFKPYDTRPIAGGFIDSRFMTGIKPQEFFFHCMAGREGLIDTAVKTSRSGYLQRCLIKLLEGIVVNYDGTARDSDGSVIQFQYGEDSMDVCKSQYLKKGPQLDFLADNLDAIISKEDINRAKVYSEPRAKKVKKQKKTVEKYKKNLAKHTSLSNNKLRIGGHIVNYDTNSSDIIKPINRQATPIEGENTKGWMKLKKLSERCPDPVVSLHRPESNFGSVSEAVDDMINNYVEENKSRTNNARKFDEDELRDKFYMKVMQAQVEPGEPVGVLAAQSVGEPSTQMTLNTFHFAGRGEMNVTLGIPRLREILMVASTNIKTPSLTIPFRSGIKDKSKEKTKVLMNRCSLADVLKSVQVGETLKLKGDRSRIIKLRFEYLSRSNYKDKFCVKPSEVLEYFETRYISKGFMPLLSAVMKDKKLVVETGLENEKKGRNGNTENEDKNNINEESDRRMDQIDAKGTGEGHASSDEEDLADDADATDARKKSRQKDEDFEEGLSDEDNDMINAINIDDQDILYRDENDEETKMSWALSNEADDGIEVDMPLHDDNQQPTQQELEEMNMDSTEAKKRRLYVKNLLQGKSGLATILDYKYDTEKELWCELTLSFSISRKAVDMSNIIRKSAERAVLHEIKNIKRGIIVQNEKGEDCLQTEGVNIDAIFKHESVLDLNRLYCNNIHDMARYYGIEAANKTIVKEIVNVFKAYGIDVDKRHLSLVADYMTFDGTYRPFNRIGIENNPSPLQQMTFETAIGFLRTATLAGKCDSLDSPSSRLVIGKPCNGGTGSFGVMQKLICNNIREHNSLKV